MHHFSESGRTVVGSHWVTGKFSVLWFGGHILSRVWEDPLPALAGANISECECVLSRVWLCKSMDYSLSGSSFHGILQARILEWVAVSSSRGSSLTQESNSRLLHWQTDSLLLSHQGSLANIRQNTNSGAATVWMHALIVLEKWTKSLKLIPFDQG